MSDEMAEAHARDMEKERRLREAYQALYDLRGVYLRPDLAAEVAQVRVRIANEMNHIVARWN